MRLNTDHHEVILAFAGKNPVIITNKFKGPLGNSLSTKLWEQLTNQLNGLGYGILTENEYKRRLTDWKSKTKGKAADLDKSKRRTGGGQSSNIKLSKQEERLLALMGKSAIKGDDGIKEFGVGLHVQELRRKNVSEKEPVIMVENLPITPSASDPDNNFIQPTTDWETYTVSLTYELVDHGDDHTYSFLDEPDQNLCSQSNIHVTDSIKDKNIPKEKPRSVSTNRRRKIADMTTEVKIMNEETLCVLRSIDNNLVNINTSLISISDTLSIMSDSLLKIITDKNS